MGLKKTWQTFKRAKPGTRFEKMHEARAGGPPPAVLYALGGLLLVGGVVLLFIPGPGLLLIAFGAALLARQSSWLAERLDRGELVLRKLARRGRLFWNRASGFARAALVAATALCAAGVAYVGYLWLFAD